jgi:hypothetical protein
VSCAKHKKAAARGKKKAVRARKTVAKGASRAKARAHKANPCNPAAAKPGRR